MNIARTQYIENNFSKYHGEHRMFLSWISAEKQLSAVFKTILQNGSIPLIACVIILACVTGYVAAIHYTMALGVSMKEEQTSIKFLETDVLRKETILANTRTLASLQKQKDIMLMENVDRIHYILPNTAVAEASQDQAIR